MSWDPTKDQVNACRQLQENFRMNAEKVTGEHLAQQKGENVAKAAYEKSVRQVNEFYKNTDSIGIDKTKNPGFGQRRQNVVRNMIEIHQQFSGQATQAFASMGPAMPATFASGTSAAMTLGRMGAAGAGFSSLGLIASVATVVSFAYIVVVFATALSQVAAENRKLREELEAAREKAFWEWLENRPQAKPPIFMPRVAR